MAYDLTRVVSSFSRASALPIDPKEKLKFFKISTSSTRSKASSRFEDFFFFEANGATIVSSKSFILCNVGCRGGSIRLLLYDF